MSADRENSPRGLTPQEPVEWKVPAGAESTACRFCGAPVVFAHDGARIRCLDARTIRVLPGKHGRAATQHRCIAAGGGR